MWTRIVLGSPWYAVAAWVLGSLPAIAVGLLGRGPGRPLILTACAGASVMLATVLVVHRRLAARAVRRQAALGVTALEAMLRQRTP
ncbi:MAG: hypothetical protein U0S36_01150 [Candidatus Nanopelagicales bacterium]|jgi:hypothetical protein